jgi:uncharacterized protein (TIGR03437 family)
MRFGQTVALLVSTWAFTRTAHSGVVNEAQRNGPQRIAPGSIVLVWAALPAPSATASVIRVANGFPLMTNLAGTSVRIVVGAVTVQAYVLATESPWVRALVPSNTPVGEGRVIVTYDGRDTPPQGIDIVERGFGIFDGTYDGPGSQTPSFTFARAVHNASPDGSTRPNSLGDSVRPGESVILRGTGLGSASGDEATGPLPGDLNIPGLAVLVGGKAASVVYAGRSQCCAGVDEVIFEVPAGIEGCNVPVSVRYGQNGHGSNEIYLSVNSNGGPCSDPHGLSQSESRALAAGDLRAAHIHALQDNDGVSWSAQLGLARNGGRIPIGTCAQGMWGWGSLTVYVPSALDAGPAINIRMARGNSQGLNLERNNYFGRINGPLSSGEYTIDNEAGGRDVGPFRATVTVPPQPSFTWTNRSELNSARISDGIPVTWLGGDPSGYVMIGGWFESGGEAWGNGGFICHEQVEKGTFTLPPALLARLASDWLDRPTYEGANSIRLWVGYTISRRFEISGLGPGILQIGQQFDMTQYKTVVLRQ